MDGWDRHEERVAINLFPAIINLRMIHRARERAQEFLMVAAVESAHAQRSGMDSDHHRNVRSVPIISGYGPDMGGPQKRNPGPRGPRT